MLFGMTICGRIIVKDESRWVEKKDAFVYFRYIHYSLYIYWWRPT